MKRRGWRELGVDGSGLGKGMWGGSSGEARPPVALGHEDGEVREGTNVENSELRCLFDVPEICFGKIQSLNS